MSTSWAIVVAKDCDRLDLIVSHFGPTSALTLDICQKSPQLSLTEKMVYQKLFLRHLAA
ncbi:MULTISPECIES: hypothetical protein [Arthrospira]|uniref:hypothetical protein n=1 Tax=Oscillatoriales TaxID=1150 RepID=UPI0001D0EBD0|nr:hypothetical protein [Arthrospira platensis]MBD2671147.1 hypothetical protein [Arthrospira platensis FACHB-439]MBD2712340.1 hypothetical protein [Arthrospira platensis FACHB-835]MDF2209540.1 hypothetical protein [Arthrospira platensis NCB002]MDT9185053.1 hypothetical protein [Limnospira sp. PMC 289.06]MDT9297235.1 hypothetical protein [Arthrospira platensis PCC 7345]MDT9312750.1 hypothetical protein [Limnospira sp. Paracas R14]QQW31159.1 hypothetical protein AP9108_11605 [Arthrospira sp. 